MSDKLSTDDGRMMRLKVRSMVGLVPLFAVETLEPGMLDRLQDWDPENSESFSAAVDELDGDEPFDPGLSLRLDDQVGSGTCGVADEIRDCVARHGCVESRVASGTAGAPSGASCAC